MPDGDEKSNFCDLLQCDLVITVNPLNAANEPSDFIRLCNIKETPFEGLRENDLLLEFNGKPVFTIKEVQYEAANLPEGGSCCIHVRNEECADDPADDRVIRVRLNPCRDRIMSASTTEPLPKWVGPELEDDSPGASIQRRAAPHLDTQLSQKDLMKLTEEWSEVLSAMQKNTRSNPREDSQVRKMVRRGTPSVLRGEVWFILSGAREKYQPNYYANTLKKRVPSDVIYMIDKDLLRTFPSHPEFSVGSPGLRKLKRILYGYAAFDPEVQYVQGMSFLCGALLSYTSEENSFWILVQMMSEYGFHNVLKEGFPLVMQLLKHLQALMEKTVPKLLSKMNEQLLDLSVFARWFCTIFSNELDFYSFTRIWDGFWLYGWAFIINFIVVVFKCCEPELLKCDHAEFISNITNMKILIQNKNLEEIIYKSFEVKIVVPHEPWDSTTRRNRGKTMALKPVKDVKPANFNDFGDEESDDGDKASTCDSSQLSDDGFGKSDSIAQQETPNKWKSPSMRGDAGRATRDKAIRTWRTGARVSCVRAVGFKGLDDVSISLGDITVILGPHNSRKSTIADAVAVSLIMSKELRGAQSCVASEKGKSIRVGMTESLQPYTSGNPSTLFHLNDTKRPIALRVECASGEQLMEASLHIGEGMTLWAEARKDPPRDVQGAECDDISAPFHVVVDIPRLPDREEFRVDYEERMWSLLASRDVHLCARTLGSHVAGVDKEKWGLISTAMTHLFGVMLLDPFVASVSGKRVVSISYVNQYTSDKDLAADLNAKDKARKMSNASSAALPSFANISTYDTRSVYSGSHMFDICMAGSGLRTALFVMLQCALAPPTSTIILDDFPTKLSSSCVSGLLSCLVHAAREWGLQLVITSGSFDVIPWLCYCTSLQGLSLRSYFCSTSALPRPIPLSPFDPLHPMAPFTKDACELCPPTALTPTPLSPSTVSPTLLPLLLRAAARRAALFCTREEAAYVINWARVLGVPEYILGAIPIFDQHGASFDVPRKLCDLMHLSVEGTKARTRTEHFASVIHTDSESSNYIVAMVQGTAVFEADDLPTGLTVIHWKGEIENAFLGAKEGLQKWCKSVYTVYGTKFQLKNGVDAEEAAANFVKLLTTFIPPSAYENNSCSHFHLRNMGSDLIVEAFARNHHKYGLPIPERGDKLRTYFSHLATCMSPAEVPAEAKELIKKLFEGVPLKD